MNAYTPGGLLAQLATSGLAVLPYVGAAVAGGLVLMFAFFGIRKGLHFFRHVADVPLPVGYSTYEGGSAGMNPDPTSYGD